MNLLNKIKSQFLNTVIILVLIINIYLAFYFLKLFEIPNFWLKLALVSLFFIIETLIIFVSIKYFYSNPIKKLVFNIKKATLNQEKIKFQKSLNPDISYINTFFYSFLEWFRWIKKDFLKWKVIKWEVELAKEIQEKLLNKKIIVPPSLNIVAKAKPLWEIWWDSFDIIRKDDNYYIYIWDATWHGVWAWFIMVMVNALIEATVHNYISWADILTLTNRFIKTRIKANLLMSLLLVRWNEKEKRFFMTWAWHEYLLIYKHKQRKCFKIKTWWLALWMMRDISKITNEREIKFEENDIAILYSDWITDAINSSDNSIIKERFWETRLIKAIENAGNVLWKDYKTAQSVFNNITLELSKFMWYKHVQVDDITLVVIHFKWNDYDSIKDFSNDLLKDKSFITEWNWD